MKVIYIAGRFRGETAWDVAQNIRAAEHRGFEVAQLGAMPLIPHANTAQFDRTLTGQFWLDGTMELLRRCDAVLTVDNWPQSSGARAEVKEAEARGIPVFHHLDNLRVWLNDGARPGLERHHKSWTQTEDHRLRMLWGELTVKGVAAKLQRTQVAVYARAGELGLARGIQPGTECLKTAATRTGYSCWGLRTVLAWAKVDVEEPASLHRRAKANRRWNQAQLQIHEVDAAIEAWLRLEIVGQAAGRRGIDAHVLRAWLKEAGHVPPAARCTWRLAPEVIDAVVAARLAKETLKAAGARVGLSAETLRKHLRAAGVHREHRPGVPWLILPADVDRVVAALPAATWAHVRAQTGGGR